MTEMFDALHPDPTKAGTRLNAERYRLMRDALLAVIPAEPPGVAFSDLAERVRPLLAGTAFGDASIKWHVTTVKLDLEARGRVERVAGRGPQRVVLSPQYAGDA
jgi:hypothetical protein